MPRASTASSIKGGNSPFPVSAGKAGGKPALPGKYITAQRRQAASGLQGLQGKSWSVTLAPLHPRSIRHITLVLVGWLILFSTLTTALKSSEISDMRLARELPPDPPRPGT